MARSRNIYTSSAVLRVLFKFTPSDRLYGDSVSPESVTRAYVFK